MQKTQQKGSLGNNCGIRKVNRFRIIDYPIDLMGIFLGLVAFGLLIYLAVKYVDDPVNDQISSASMKNIVFAVVGIAGYMGLILGNRIFNRKNVCKDFLFNEPYPIPIVSVNPNAFSFYDQRYKSFLEGKQGKSKESMIRSRLNENDKTELKKTYGLMQYLIYIGICIMGYFIIQALIIILLGEPIFQVVVFDVYAYFISGAIAEELLFRGFLTTLFQLIFTFVIIGSFRKNKDQISKSKIYIVNILSALSTGLIFFAFHTRYYSSVTASTITIVIGFYQGLWFLYTKSLLVVMASHVVGNWISAGTLVQQLGL